MAARQAFAAAVSLSMLFALSPATAQTPPAESIQIGLSTDAVSITAGFSGADLVNLVNTAVDLAIEESLADGTEHPVSPEHFAEAQREVRPTTLEWLTTARNYAKYSNSGGQYDDVAAFLKANGL